MAGLRFWFSAAAAVRWTGSARGGSAVVHTGGSANGLASAVAAEYISFSRRAVEAKRGKEERSRTCRAAHEISRRPPALSSKLLRLFRRSGRIYTPRVRTVTDELLVGKVNSLRSERRSDILDDKWYRDKYKDRIIVTVIFLRLSQVDRYHIWHSIYLFNF